MTKKQQAELTEAQRSCIVTKRRGNQNVVNAFWGWCRQNKKPYVEIVIEGRKAYVSVDMPNVSGLLGDSGQVKLRKLCLAYGFTDHGTRRIPGVEGLSKGDAMPFAEAFAAICLEWLQGRKTDQERDKLDS